MGEIQIRDTVTNLPAFPPVANYPATVWASIVGLGCLTASTPSRGEGAQEQTVTTGQHPTIPTEQASSTEGGHLSKAE